MDLGFYSYLSAALGFGFLAALLAFSWRSSAQGVRLNVVVVTTVVWAITAAMVTDDRVEPIGSAYLLLETLRYIAWYIFLLKLFEPAAKLLDGRRPLRQWGLQLFVGLALLMLVLELFIVRVSSSDFEQGLLSWRFTGHLLLAMIGLAIIEQLFRNTVEEYRYRLKFLFIGAGGIFVYDFYLYANALLFLGLDRDLWEARGFVNLVAVPLLTIAAAQNRGWSPNIFVSRDIVLHTTTLVGSGLYLLAMAAAGYYIQQYGGSWGKIAQVAFFSLALALLVVVLFSAQMRRQLRVFLVKHFYRNKHDYRQEWLNLTAALNDQVRDVSSLDATIRILARFVGARGGLLWLADGQGRFRNVASWQMRQVDTVLNYRDPLIDFFGRKSYVVNFQEVRNNPDEYGELLLPDWIHAIDQVWLAVPLPGLDDNMTGFVLLTSPQERREVDWEDRDLLKAAARQVSSHIAVLMASDALAESRQFEVFNRMSAYMVHDLKNIAAGLEMVAINAEKYRDNPEFLDDAFSSVSSASADIRRMLDQLRNKRIQEEGRARVDLGSLAEEATSRLTHKKPVPELVLSAEACHAIVEKKRLENVLVHLIENAQQATTDDGFVRVGLKKNGRFCTVDIQDNGHGMDDEFIRLRLFKPFDTTKGNAGMGIGMYESREYIRKLGGEIHVESWPGTGTQIRLDIPLASSE